ncbi:uncharacterized protein LOC104424524 isoform X1 [Eucalyptus grandis]|uniref:uncharacterized protein LOC104424524 isoform X1 n=1 Tax=Eucalyptus grandis TaxID=71139 RepID=UPI00192EA6C2|nr:uncharacterized protein LOC104424524 isoform X1 [Eucalyptus grandis]
MEGKPLFPTTPSPPASNKAEQSRKQTRVVSMAPKVKTLVLVFLMLLMISFSLAGLPGEVDGSGGKPSFPKVGERLKMRKLMMAESLLDYEDVCANPKHDPRKKGCKNNR